MDATIRALEHAALKGDEIAARRLVEERRRGGFDQALRGWVERLRGALVAHLRDRHPTLGSDPAYVARECAVRLEPGPKFVRVVVGSSAYAFAERATGNLLKPGGWKGPEPRRIVRGSIYAANPLEGCGPYGVAYANGGGGSGFGQHADAAPIVEAPKVPENPARKALLPPGKTVRACDTFGACVLLGRALEESATHYTYRDLATGKTKRAKKDARAKYAGARTPRPHVEPCERCLDHPESIFGPGRCSIHGRAEPCTTCQET